MTSTSLFAIFLGSAGVIIALIRALFGLLMSRRSNVDISVTTYRGDTFKISARGVNNEMVLDALRQALAETSIGHPEAPKASAERIDDDPV
jgi:hypothetical protein